MISKWSFNGDLIMISQNLLQANTVVKNEALTLHDYDATHEGMIQSWAERFPAEEFAQIDADLKKIADKDQAFFTSTA